jgi:hypothetical protein
MIIFRRWSCLFALILTPLLTQAAVLLTDEFNGTGDPDSSVFEWGGDVTRNGSGLLSLSTDSANTSWLRALPSTAATPGVGDTLVVEIRAYAYAEDWNPGVYGDKQPRGLRVGSDPDNAIEFYSLTRTTVGMRMRTAGVEVQASYPLPAGVDSMHDYGISVTTTSVTFTVDGALAGTLTHNLPVGSLNVFVSTYDGGAGNVPVTVDRITLTMNSAPVQTAAEITGFTPTIGPVGTSVAITGTNFSGVTNVQFGGASAWFTNNSDTLITAVVPTNAASGFITVASSGGTVASTNSFSVSEFGYNVTNGFVTITRYLGTNTVAVIPPTIDGYIVYHIGDAAFQGQTALTSVTLPGPLVSIGASAFFYCINLTNVPIPGYVTNIGEHAFSRCEKLAAFNVSQWSSSYTNISGVLFTKDRTALIAYPCGKGGSYTIPTGTKRIAPTAFAYCAAFFSSITSISMNSDLRDIGNSAFMHCVRLTSVSLNSGITNIGTQAFYDCNTMSSITIPSSVTRIADQAFYATGPSIYSIPSSVTNIGFSVFGQCRNLTAINIMPGNPNYSSFDGVLFDKTQSSLMQYPRGKTNVTYTVPGTVRVIQGASFVQNVNLVGVSIPEGVTNIGAYSFQSCTRLASVTIPNSVITLGDYAFLFCSGLTNVILPSGLTSIPAGLFFGCSGLDHISIPNSVTSIGDIAFQSCSALRSLTLPSGIASLGNSVFNAANSMASIYLRGNAPTIGTNIFGANNSVTVYFLPGTTGWDATFAGHPAVMWNPEIQLAGLQTNQFGFSITGNSNLVVVVNACTNLADPVWVAVQTNILSNGSADFRDPTWTNYPGRYYSLTWPQ